MLSALGAASYGAASLAFLILVLLLAVGWRGRVRGLRLIAAAGVSALWAASMAWQAGYGTLPAVAVLTLELLRDAAWLIVLLDLARGVLPRAMVIVGHALWVVLLAGGWLLAVLQSWVVVDTGPGDLLAPGGLAVALAGLVLIEQVYRHSSAEGRHGLKFLALGLGGIFAYDLFLFSQGELFREVPEDAWLARGAVNAALVPFIAIAARRNPQWSLDVFVSRQVVVFTSSVAAVGAYLVLLAVGGYYVREFGGSWGVIANLVFLAGALIVLGVIVMSGAVRRRLRVFVSKHFFRNKYDYRVEWLRFVATLSAAGTGDVRRTSLQAIAQIFESAGGVLFVADPSGGDILPAAAWPMRLEAVQGLEPLPADDSLARFLKERQWVIDLNEYRSSPGAYGDVAIPPSLAAIPRARMIAPLLQPDRLAGFVVLLEPPPPFELTYEDRDLLKTVGRHVATIIAQHEADLRLAESRQFEAYHRLTAFMMHDLKNAVAQLQLVVHNAEKHRHDPAFIDDALATIANAVERINRLIEQLRDRNIREHATRVDLVPLVRAVIAICADRRPVPRLGAAEEGSLRVLADYDRLAASLEHVVRNAQDATPADGSIEVVVRRVNGSAEVEVTDSGAGMTADFVRERLFRPFDSTKGAKGMGIGAHQVREYVRSLGGDVRVRSQPGTGTRFAVTLPLSAGSEAADG